MADASGANAAPWMEVETLAAHLVPLLERYDVKWRGYGVIYVDHEHYNIDTAHRILADLSASFGVPSALIRSRLIDVGWLNDVRSTLSGRADVACAIDRLTVCAADTAEDDDPELDEEYRQD